MDPNNPPVELYPCSIISSQEVFIRMKWDKFIVKDAALEHLFLSSKVLEPKLPTAWLVHTVSVVFASGKLHLFSIKIRFGWHLVLIKGLSQQFLAYLLLLLFLFILSEMQRYRILKYIHLLRRWNLISWLSRRREEMSSSKSLCMNASLSLLRKETFLPRYDLQRDCWISCMQMPTQLLSVGSFWPVYSMSAKRFCLWERYSNTCY